MRKEDFVMGSAEMLVKDAQREVRTVYIGGYREQLVSSAIWLASAALATWSSPRAGIVELVVRLFHLSDHSTAVTFDRQTGISHARKSVGKLAMQIAFLLPVTMLLLVPVSELNLNLFYPALIILVGAHYLPFTFLYGIRIFLPLSAILAGGGVGLALYFPGTFSLGGWIGGLTLFIFAWIGRVSVQNDLRVET